MACAQPNPNDANFCHQCGNRLSASADAVATESLDQPGMATDETLWRQFIGPNADHYLFTFRRFSSNGQPRFALSWNWPAFLFMSFLWFLYRKMYLHAGVYAVGPMISTYITGDLTVGLVWSVMAGATANYLYYWHCKEEIAELKKAQWMNHSGRDAAAQETGGVQPYVIWVGVAFYVIFFAALGKMIEEGPPDAPRPVTPASHMRA